MRLVPTPAGTHRSLSPLCQGWPTTSYHTRSIWDSERRAALPACDPQVVGSNPTANTIAPSMPTKSTADLSSAMLWSSEGWNRPPWLAPAGQGTTSLRVTPAPAGVTLTEHDLVDAARRHTNVQILADVRQPHFHVAYQRRVCCCLRASVTRARMALLIQIKGISR